MSGAKRACESLKHRPDISNPILDVICADPTPSKIEAAIGGVPPRALVVAGIEASSNIDTALAMGIAANTAGAMFAIAEQSLGSPSLVFSAGQLLSLVYYRPMAILREYDFIAEGTVLQLLIESFRRPRVRAVLIGDPARRLKALLDEIRLDWNDPEIGLVSGPMMTFRLACTLTQVAELGGHLDSRTKIAHELCNCSLFPYNIEDTRKAVGSLTKVWGLHTRTLYLLPKEAKRRGFPDPAMADALFDFIERIDTEERWYTSASGYQFDILYISET